ncbi:MAG: type III ribulose-bisphosphate carboxylase [Candidatus Hydrothermarchaeaceae archaeon]
MEAAKMKYVNLDYKPTDRDLIAEYYIEPSGISFEGACESIAAESSIGTWTELTTMKREIAEKLKPNVFSIDEARRVAKIAYPEELFEAGNMPQILSSLAGNIFGVKDVENLRFLDVRFPRSIVDSFKGPRFGIDGIRKFTGVKDRPFIGTIIKPKLGLDEREHAAVAYQAWVGGVDIVKDDENLSSMRFNPFEGRIKETLRLRDKAEKETGEKKIYMPNITAETREMLRRAEVVSAEGGEYVMVDILTSGWSALQTLRDEGPELIIHAHRAGHAAMTRNPRHGISMKVIAKVARLIGVDQIHIGTFGVGKMTGRPEEDLEYKRALTEDMDKKAVLPVASGGLHPGQVERLLKISGPGIVIQMGGGIHGHPEGTMKGAMALRQAVEAFSNDISLADYAKDHRELRDALNRWGSV